MLVTRDINDTTLKRGDIVNISSSYSDYPDGVFKCCGSGFGCSPDSDGKVFGTWVNTGDEGWIRRRWIVGFSSESDVKAAQVWSAKPTPVQNADIASNMVTQMNNTMKELNSDTPSRVTKDQLRLALLQYYTNAQQLADMVKEGADAYQDK